jgi:hypothetical protein
MMTNKQTIEKARQEVSKKYKDRISELEKQNKEQRELITALRDDNTALSSKVLELQEWVDRMQEFCNMSDADRESYIARNRYEEQLLHFSTPFLRQMMSAVTLLSKGDNLQ